MKKHVVWQPHVEPELLLNPFISPEQRYKSAPIDLFKAHRGELEVGDDGVPLKKETMRREAC